ncbi:MAG: IPT/TIG domain-containing protein [Planctomycetes bacterium]|nr:IPT/TIG domain-containing protein [Planctomycetota bacterium]
MRRSHLVATLLILAFLLLAGAWAILRPEGSGFIPFIGGEDTKPADKVADDALDLEPPRLDDSGTPVVKPPANAETAGILDNIDEEERKRIEAAREEARIEAEREAAANGTKPRPEGGGKSPQTDDANQPDNRTPEQKALDAERQRRIDALKAIKRPPNQSLGNARPRTRKLAKETGKKNLDEVNPKLLQDRRGLYAKYYAFSGNPLAGILDPNQPELNDRTPDITRIDSQVYFPSKDAWADLPFDKRNFMGVWEGFLVIAEDADYWLYLGADYTGVVTLDGETILFNDMRDYTEVSTVLTLSSGLHPIRIDYMEGENGSPVDPLAACNFMHVPEGQSKPVPVPPEMLMLPEALWSNNAPIITRLNKYEGEIGEEITIYGQNITPYGNEEGSREVRVTFSGQQASVLKQDSGSVTVRVPIGATSGKVIVFAQDFANWVLDGETVASPMGEYPSNSVEFSVTTQFGLFASWHNLQGWSNYDFVDESLHEPDVVRLEREFMFETRDQIDLPFRNNPLACHWEGKVGIPAGWVAEGELALVRFQTYGRLRVKLGEVLKETTAPTQEQFNLTTLDFEVRNHEEHYLTLSIDWTSESGPAGLSVVKMHNGDPSLPSVPPMGLQPSWQVVETLQNHLFFPPVVPPKPPQILSAKPVFAEGEQPPQLPFDVTSTLPSIREGQTCEITLRAFGKVNEEMFESLSLTIDGIPMAWDTPDDGMDVVPDAGGFKFTVTCVLPTGLGEGRIVPRQSIVTGEPYFIDVLNKGLVAYLYDLPNPGGYTKMPDPEPLNCFQVRKMPWVNYENANQLDLPFPAETFAIEWLGALIIETEGDYRFTCRSDDGILVWLDDNIVLADDNLHYQREKTGDWVHLVPGTYKFRMQFFENNVHEVCVLSWDARTDKQDDKTEFLPRQIIGKRHFTWDEHPPLPGKTSTYKRADGSDPD